MAKLYGGANAIHNLELKGDTFQQTYTGKNLFHYTTITSVRCSYVDTDGKIVCTATGNSPSITITVSQIPAGTYTCSGSLSGLTVSPRDTNNASLGVNFSSLPSTITTSAAMGYITFYSSATSGQTFTIDLSDFQIETGSTASEYEPYVGGIPSPNPDYPQDIQVVTGDQTVKVTGKNLHGGYPSDFSVTRSGVSFVCNKDGSISASGTATDNNAFSMYSGNATNAGWVQTYQPGTYTLSGGTSKIVVFFSTTDGSTSYQTSIVSGSITFTLTESHTAYIRIQVRNGETADTTIYPQLELGSTATAYEPYQGQSYEVNLGKNLVPFTDQDFTLNSVRYYVENGSLILNGNSTGETV